MKLNEIRRLVSYTGWANRRLLEASRSLSPAAFARDLSTSHGSLRGTFVHLLWGEWVWLQRWRGTSPRRVFSEDEFSDVDAIAARWAQVEHDRDDLLNGLTDDRLLAPLSYENLQGQRWEYPLGDMMQHVVNHSSYHRGQVVTLLRQLGQVPPSTDFLVFFDEVAPAHVVGERVPL